MPWFCTIENCYIVQKREKTGNIKNNSKNNVRFLMFLRYIYREHFKVLNFLTITLQKCNNIIVYSKLILRKINSKFIKKGMRFTNHVYIL